MLHGVAIGDVCGKRPGSEIVVCGFNHRVILLALSQGRWTAETIYVGNDRLKIVQVADVLGSHEGHEVLVCGSDGKVVVLWEGLRGWHHEEVYSDTVGQSRVAAGAAGVLIGGDGGKVTLATREGTAWRSTFLARDCGKIRGVAVADVDASVAGAELYACGYSKNVTQLVRDGKGFWHSRVVYTAGRPLHHLVAGQIDVSRVGLELVTCGHGGELVVLWAE
jgi:hypothetical protein